MSGTSDLALVGLACQNYETFCKSIDALSIEGLDLLANAIQADRDELKSTVKERRVPAKLRGTAHTRQYWKRNRMLSAAFMKATERWVRRRALNGRWLDKEARKRAAPKIKSPSQTTLKRRAMIKKIGREKGKTE